MLRSYSPKDVNVSFFGIAITGFAPDSFIRCRRNSDILMETVGSQGELSLTRNADKTGEVEIELMQTSESNLLLSGLMLAMEYSEGTGIIPVGEVIIQDPSGSALVLVSNAYIKKMPEIELGAEQTSRVWTFGCENLIYTSTPTGLVPDFNGLSI